MKELYEELEMDVIYFAIEDVIRTSGPTPPTSGGGGGDDGGDGEGLDGVIDKLVYM